jgi:hypothetical protein
LDRGGRAVLSGWGGHEELARLFPGQVQLVRVNEQRNGQMGVQVEKFAKAMMRMLQAPSWNGPKSPPLRRTPIEASRHLRRWLMDEKLGNHVREMSKFGWKFVARHHEFFFPSDQIFFNRQDPYCRPFKRAYGARKAQIKR